MSIAEREERLPQTGSVRVLPAECEFAADYSKANVVLESEEEDNLALAIDELGSVAVRNLALGYAAHSGVPDPRINGNNVGPYAVNKNGIRVEEVKGEDGKVLPPRHPDRQPVRYRVEVPVTRKLL